MRSNDRVEVLGATDHHLASDDGLDAVRRGSFARQYAFAGETQRDDLPPAGGIGFEFGEDARTDEHHLTARRSDLAERTPRLDLNHAVRHLIEQIREMRIQTRGNQRIAEGNTLRGSLGTSTRYRASPQRRKVRLFVNSRKYL
jgi:hypothetical protein